MDPDSEIQYDFPPFIRIYKSGRVERLVGTSVVPPSADPTTNVSSKDVTIDPATGVSARLYLPNNPNPTRSKKSFPIVIYYHGGGFCTQSAFSPTYHNFLNLFASKAQALIVSVNYRLAPEHKLPAAYDDSWAAFKWAASGRDGWFAGHGDSSRIFVAGDSAGANIAHETALRAGKIDKTIAGMMLIHPYFGMEVADDAGGETLEEFCGVLGLTEDACRAKHNPMAGGAEGMRPAACGRVMVCVATEDLLGERGRGYYAALKGSGWGGEAELVESEGEGHVFHLMKPECEKGAELMERLVAFVSKEP